MSADMLAGMGRVVDMRILCSGTFANLRANLQRHVLFDNTALFCYHLFCAIPAACVFYESGTQSVSEGHIPYGTKGGAQRMERWIPYEKLSKKKQREWNAKKRGSWHGVNPISRKTKNLKAYNRKKTRQRIDDPFDVSFCFLGKALEMRAAFHSKALLQDTVYRGS